MGAPETKGGTMSDEYDKAVSEDRARDNDRLSKDLAWQAACTKALLEAQRETVKENARLREALERIRDYEPYHLRVAPADAVRFYSEIAAAALASPSPTPVTGTAESWLCKHGVALHLRCVDCEPAPTPVVGTGPGGHRFEGDYQAPTYCRHCGAHNDRHP
jgi:hypothetical protein